MAAGLVAAGGAVAVPAVSRLGVVLLGWGPPGVVTVVIAVAAGLVLVVWGLTWLGWAHARMSAELLTSPDDELRAQVETLAVSSVRAQDRLLLERRMLQQRLHDVVNRPGVSGDFLA